VLVGSWTGGEKLFDSCSTLSFHGRFSLDCILVLGNGE